MSSMTNPAKGPAAGAGAGPGDHDEPKRQKRVRMSRPKVKTGCANCKIRRIKCDELRPSCTQCVRASKTCVGYPPPPRSARPFEEIRIAPKPGLALAGGPPRPIVPIVPIVPTPRGLAPQLSLPQRYGSEPLAPVAPVAPVAPGQLRQNGMPYKPNYQPVAVSSRRTQKAVRRANAANNAVAPVQAQAAVPSVFLYNPSTSLPFNEHEYLYFKLFQTHTSNELSGFFDDVFWSQSVLRECHHQSAIRHAVVALGALYMTLEKTTESPPNSPSDRPYDYRDSAASHWEVALKQYSHAINVTKANAQNGLSLRTQLMANVLLACFDSFIGHHRQAITQIQAGLTLLEQVRKDRYASADPIEDELTQMFTRLAIQAKSYDMAFHFPAPFVVRLLSPQALDAAAAGLLAQSRSRPSGPSRPVDTPSPASPQTSSTVSSPVSPHQEPIPMRFVSLRQARLAWDTLCEQIFRGMEVMHHMTNGPPNLLPSHLIGRGDELFVARVTAWSRAFEPLLQGRHNPGVSAQEKTGVAVLKMFQIMALILCLMTFSHDEMTFDNHRQYFENIVELASEVVSDEERMAMRVRCPDPSQCSHRHYHDAFARNPNFASEFRKGFVGEPGHIKASFSADLGIVPPLFVVATKSRDRVLRRRAIQLLRTSARREGMWDSELAAKIAIWVVEIEEENEEEDFAVMLSQQQATVQASVASPGVYTYANASYGAPYEVPFTSGAMVSQSPVFPASMPVMVTGPSLQSATSDSMPIKAEADRHVGDLLGSGGHALWDDQQASEASALHPVPSPHMLSPHTLSPHMLSPGPISDAIPYYLQIQAPVPAHKRILIKACEFDLHRHTATLKCGTRGLSKEAPDSKTRITEIKW